MPCVHLPLPAAQPEDTGLEHATKFFSEAAAISKCGSCAKRKQARLSDQVVWVIVDLATGNAEDSSQFLVYRLMSAVRIHYGCQ